MVSVGTGDPELVCTISSQQEQYSFGFTLLVLAMEGEKSRKGGLVSAENGGVGGCFSFI